MEAKPRLVFACVEVWAMKRSSIAGRPPPATPRRLEEPTRAEPLSFQDAMVRRAPVPGLE
jgi:hypothetical protein